MLDGLAYGWRTAVLSVAILLLLTISAALLRPIENRVANRTLAALLVVLAGILTPWMIGFAGFYDKWQWLSFAPFSIMFAMAPLFYLYIHALVKGDWPPRGWRHLLPAIVQFAYLSAAFLLLRQPFKNEWLSQSNFAYSLIVALGVSAGMLLYSRTGLQLLREYRAALVQQRSDDHLYAARWLSSAIAALLALLVIWSAYSIWDLIWTLDYRGLMGLYIGIAAVALFLAIEGWRHANLPFPKIAKLEEAPDSKRDWRATGEAWAEQIRRERWHADPDLSIAVLARRLGTNTGYVSRALNEGLGVNFSTFVNNLRCEDVTAAIEAGDGGDLLDLALDAGFSSKASFNRAFLARYAMAPSAFRRRHVSKEEI